MSNATACAPPALPPICELCSHAWPVGLQVLCHCPQLVEHYGLQTVRVMRSEPGACDMAQHRSIHLPYIEH